MVFECGIFFLILGKSQKEVWMHLTKTKYYGKE